MFKKLWDWLDKVDPTMQPAECNCACINCLNDLHMECALYCRRHPATML